MADFALQRNFEWETAAACLSIPDDTGTVAVVDGSESTGRHLLSIILNGCML